MLPPSAALHPLAATATNLFYRRISMNFFNFAISFFFFPFLSCSLSDFGIVAFKLDSSPAFFFLDYFLICYLSSRSRMACFRLFWIFCTLPGVLYILSFVSFFLLSVQPCSIWYIWCPFDILLMDKFFVGDIILFSTLIFRIRPQIINRSPLHQGSL